MDEIAEGWPDIRESVCEPSRDDGYNRSNGDYFNGRPVPLDENAKRKKAPDENSKIKEIYPDVTHRNPVLPTLGEC